MPALTDDARARREVAAVGAVAFAVAMWGLGARSFWLDEAYTASTIDRSFPALVELTFRDEGYQIFHQWMLWPIAQVSTQEWWLRLPSAFAYVACVVTVGLVARRHLERRGAVLAAALVAANGFAILLAQEARSYPFAMVTAALAVGAFADSRALSAQGPAAAGRARWRWCGWAVCTAWLHGFATLAAVAPIVVLIPLFRRAPELRRHLVSVVAATAVGVALPLWLPLAHTNVRNDYEFLPDLSVRTVRDVAFAFFGRSGLLAVVVALGVLAAATVSVRDRAARSRLAPFWCAAVLPGVAIGLASVSQPILLDRYLAGSIPSAAILAAFGIRAIVQAWPRGTVIVAVLVVAASAISVHKALTRPALEDWRGATAELAALAEPGDALLTSVDEELVALEYSRRTTSIDDIAVAWPVTEWGRFRTGDQGPTQLEPDDAAAAIDALADDPPRIWIVDAKRDDAEVDLIVAALDEYDESFVRQHNGIRLLLLTRR